MPATSIRRFQPATAAADERPGTAQTSLTAHAQLPGDRAVCRTLLSATNALRTA